MTTPKRPWWQQATALVSLSAGGAVTGFAFAPKAAAADIQSPSNMNIRLLALTQAAKPKPADDSTLRAAIVNVATYYLRMAEGKTPAEMEQLIWQHDSLDGVDHGESCAAFASLTLELAAQVVGQQSWVSGGSTYPWPLHTWADVRVDPNPASPQIISVLQDAQAHHRWHALGGGYQPLPGDWVLFNGHVEVVTKYADGVLSTIGGDSGANLSVNAHEYSGSLASDGVVGFVNNGNLAAAASGGSGGHARLDPGSGSGTGGQPGSGLAGGGQAGSGPSHGGQGGGPHGGGTHQGGGQTDAGQAPGQQGKAAIPGMPTAAGTPAAAGPRPTSRARRTSTRPEVSAAIPGVPAVTPADQQGPETPRRSAGQAKARADHPGGSPTGQQDHAAPPSGRDPHTTTQGGQATGGGSQTSHPSGGDRTGGSGSGRSHTGLAAHGGGEGPGSPGWSEIPGVPASAEASAAKPTHPTHPTAPKPARARSSAPSRPARATPVAAAPTSAERTFIEQIAPGAMAAQRKYGVPAAVTIAQAIVESGWGSSTLAAQDHNLFGIKGTGPAGGAFYPTTEYVNGRPVTRTAEFRVYHDVAQSIEDHGKLLADSGYYGQAMASRHDPDAFANALTGVYATDPDYGTKIIGMMQQYHLYRYDAGAPVAPHATGGGPTSGGVSGTAGTPGPNAPGPGGSGTTPTPGPNKPGSGGSGTTPTPGPNAPGSGGSGTTPTPEPNAPGSGQGGVASIPGLPFGVPPASTAPVSTPPAHRPPATTAPVGTPPASRSPRRTPSAAASPTPAASTPTPGASTSATRTAPAPTRAAPKGTRTSWSARPKPTPSQSLQPIPEAEPVAHPDAYVGPAPGTPSIPARSAQPTTSAHGRQATSRARSSQPTNPAPAAQRTTPAGSGQSATPTRSAQPINSARSAQPRSRPAPGRTDARRAPRTTVQLDAFVTRGPASPTASARTEAPTARRTPPTRPTGPTPPRTAAPANAPGSTAPGTAAAPAKAPSTAGRRTPPSAAPQRAAAPRTASAPNTRPSAEAVSARRPRPSAEYRPPVRAHGSTRTGRARYRDEIPPAVRNAFNLMAKAPLMAKKTIYEDVASNTGVGWQLLAACD